MHLQENLSGVSNIRDLSDTTIIVLGLLEMGISDAGEIARILHRRDVREVKKVLTTLRKTRNRLLRRLLDHGMPAGLIRAFPYEDSKIMCPVCRCHIQHAPCPRCNLTQTRNACVQDVGDTEVVTTSKYPHSQRPTRFAPGTKKKIEVLRRRVESGHSLFHPRDARLQGDLT
jgi:hypothetical protein